MKLVLILIFIAILSPLFAQDIDPEGRYMVTGKQLLQWQKYFNVLIYALNEKEIEAVILQSEVEKWKYKYERSRKGFWAGLSSGYPLGAQGIVMYQFNGRIGVFVNGGYAGLWTIKAGFVARIIK